jgi:hypothetical protein
MIIPCQPTRSDSSVAFRTLPAPEKNGERAWPMRMLPGFYEIAIKLP